MSLFGKILALLNVFAALGFLYLASQDWAMRQIWSAAVLRHEVAIHGLPLDEGPAVAGVPPTLTAENLGPTLLTEVFQKVGGQPAKPLVVNVNAQPSKTQLAEVLNQQIAVIDGLRKLPDETARRYEVGSILLSLAGTAVEREDTVRRLADRSVRSDALIDDLENRFKDVLRKETADGKPRDPEEHRQAIAGLLFGLSTDPAWHQRVQVVVGLNAYGREADGVGAGLKDMIARQQYALATERSDFEVLYRKLIEGQLERLANQVKDLEQIRKDQMALKTKHDAVVNARATVKAELEAQLTQLRKVVADVLASQKKLNDEVFKAQRDLATAADENLELERQIRSLEQGR